jgi:hypothetical protein
MIWSDLTSQEQAITISLLESNHIIDQIEGGKNPADKKMKQTIKKIYSGKIPHLDLWLDNWFGPDVIHVTHNFFLREYFLIT